ncbi:hypothetical protein HHI36_002163 [Cryptolaemus montrouzieri]|uniref:Ionotropic glutamate receptor C-terminal domain-containing protein n=1 Tax=Cryptolaemus montrouzieri TaxID=559131 RepID=A0ABD2PAI5_9CUCU
MPKKYMRKTGVPIRAVWTGQELKQASDAMKSNVMGVNEAAYGIQPQTLRRRIENDFKNMHWAKHRMMVELSTCRGPICGRPDAYDTNVNNADITELEDDSVLVEFVGFLNKITDSTFNLFKFCAFEDLGDFHMRAEEENYINQHPCPYIVIKLGYTFNTMHKPFEVFPTYLFFMVKKFEDVEEKLRHAFQSKFFSTRTPTFFFLNFRVYDTDIIQKLLRKIWSYGLLLSHILFVHEKVELIGFNPFKNISVNLTAKTTKKNFFTSKQFTDFNGEVLKLAVFHHAPRNIIINGKWFGEDRRFWDDLIDDLNGTWKAIIAKEYRYINALKLLENNMADFCPMRIFLVGDYKYFDYIAPLSVKYLVALVPKAKLIPQYIYLSTALSKIFWTSILLSTIALSLTILIMGRLYDGSKNQRNILYVLGVLCNQPIKRISKFHPRQIVLINIWQLTCLCILAAFQASLLGSLLIPKHEPEINTIQELYDSNVNIYVDEDFKELIYTSTPLLKNHLKPVPIFDLTRERLEFSENKAFIVTQYAAVAIINGYKQCGVNFNYRIMKEKIVPGFGTYYFKKNSPYLNIFNSMISRQFQYGLNGKKEFFTKKSTYVSTSDKISVQCNMAGVTKKYPPEKKRVFTRLSVKHLQGVFYILFAGGAISFLIFSWERFHHN